MPLTDQTLDTMTRTRIESASVTFNGSEEIPCHRDDEIALFRLLMARLGPIESVHRGEIGEYDIEMMFSGGRDPGIVKIATENRDRIEFQWGEFCYTGGDCKAFAEHADTIRNLKRKRIPIESP
jgi:hypothetical protein